MKKIYFISFLITILVGCASQGAKNQVQSLESSDSLSSDNGLLLISLGRDETYKGIPRLPFVSYGVYSQSDTSNAEKVAFLPAEAGFFNKLGKGKYGFIHYRELKPGKYLIVGQKGRGNGLDNPFGVLFLVPSGGIHYDSNGKKIDIAMEFEIEKGKINYLGEFLTIKKKLGPDAVIITDQTERDHAYLLEKYPNLSNVEFVKKTINKL